MHKKLPALIAASAMAMTTAAFAGGPDAKPYSYYLAIEGGGGAATISGFTVNSRAGTAVSPIIPLSTEDTNGVYQVGASIGMNIPDTPLRLALQYLYTGGAKFDKGVLSTNNATGVNDPIDSDLYSNAVFVNLFWDFPLAQDWNAFIGGGVGVTFNEAKTSYTQVSVAPAGGVLTASDTQEETHVAAQADAGFSYRFNPQWVLRAFYRFTYLGSVKMGTYGNFAPFFTNIQFKAGNFYTNTGQLELDYYFM